jgi:hypothetical protein
MPPLALTVPMLCGPSPGPLLDAPAAQTDAVLQLEVSPAEPLTQEFSPVPLPAAPPAATCMFMEAPGEVGKLEILA